MTAGSPSPANPLLMARRIGILKLTALGDILLATPVAANLRSANPGAFIAWIVEERFAGALANNPHLDEVVALPGLAPPSWKRWPVEARTVVESPRHFLGELRRLRLDTAVDLQGLLKSGVMALATGARWRIAGSRAREGSRYLANRIVPQLPPEVGPRDGYLRFLEHFGIPITDRRLVYSLQQPDREAASQILQELPPGPAIAFAPATSRPIKDWPAERYATLADCLMEATQAHILLLGGQKDRPIACRIQAEMETTALDLTGKTTIGQLAAVLERCSLLIAGDSGPLFLASAVGTPVLGLFGPTNGAAFASVLGQESIIWKPPPCSPCRDWNCKSRECVLAITVEEVLAKVSGLLAGQRSPCYPQEALVGGAS